MGQGVVSQFEIAGTGFNVAGTSGLAVKKLAYPIKQESSPQNEYEQCPDKEKPTEFF